MNSEDTYDRCLNQLPHHCNFISAVVYNDIFVELLNLTVEIVKEMNTGKAQSYAAVEAICPKSPGLLA